MTRFFPTEDLAGAACLLVPAILGTKGIILSMPGYKGLSGLLSQPEA